MKSVKREDAGVRNQTETSGNLSCQRRLQSWLQNPPASVYFTYFLSSWGDRMWHFAVGLYLVLFDGGKLQIAASYGFMAGGCVLLLGGIIGNWVDKNDRMKVIRVSLFVQNIAVALSAVGVCFLLKFPEYLKLALDGAAYRILEATVMLLAVIASLASVAYKISIEKDWIVIVASGDKAKLASLNAVTRAIDLLSKVLSPTIVGQVMTYGSLLMGAIFISVWNVGSVFVEYALLCRIYRLVPRLAYKRDPNVTTNDVIDKDDHGDDVIDKDDHGDDVAISTHDPGDGETPVVSNGNSAPCEEGEDLTEEGRVQGPSSERTKEKSWLKLMFTPFIRLVIGWRIYARQKIVFAGVALSFLYMTVLGFDSITVGYIYSQGVSESILGVCSAMAGLTGIIGTFLFLRTRKLLGLSRTGIIAFSVECLCLTLAVASIWAPGSPFDPDQTRKAVVPNCTSEGLPRLNSSMEQLEQNSSSYEGATRARYKRNIDGKMLDVYDNYGLDSDFSGEVGGESRDDVVLSRIVSSLRTRREVKKRNDTGLGVLSVRVVGDGVNDTSAKGNSSETCEEPNVVRTSVILFLTGIVTSRIGLWMSDLTVTQFLQESVAERERGTVNGVQSSLNMLLDMLKFIAVILAPDIHTFGILILMSFLFIILANFFFIFHVWHMNDYKCSRQKVDLEEEGKGKDDGFSRPDEADNI